MCRGCFQLWDSYMIWRVWCYESECEKIKKVAVIISATLIDIINVLYYFTATVSISTFAPIGNFATS